MSKDKIDIKEVFLRRLRGDEFEAYTALLGEADALHHAHEPALIKPPDQARPMEDDFVARLTDPHRLLDTAVVVDDAGVSHLAGLIDAQLTKRDEDRIHFANTVAWIDLIVVAEKWRRRGIGRMLLDRVRDWSATQGADRIILNVYAFNIVAARLYEKAGFKMMTKMYAKPLR